MKPAPKLMFITLFGVGYIPIASGTIASILAFLLYYTGYLFIGSNIRYLAIIFIALSFPMAIHCSLWGENFYQEKDPSKIVIDEFLGMLIALLMVKFSFIYLLFTLLFFRFFDIIKPFPINLVDKKVSGGIGIMLDDVIAGIFSAGIVNAIYLVL
jgi:phosphatidylglycerophosphatase A